MLPEDTNSTEYSFILVSIAAVVGGVYRFETSPTLGIENSKNLHCFDLMLLLYFAIKG